MHMGSIGPQQCDILGELGVKRICCAERSLLILTQNGKVYTMYYSSEAQVIFKSIVLNWLYPYFFNIID